MWKCIDWDAMDQLHARGMISEPTRQMVNQRDLALAYSPAENVTFTDKDGVIHSGSEGMLPNMARYARTTNARTLPDVLSGSQCLPRPLGQAC